MKIDENVYKKYKNDIEEDLRKYPYYLVSAEVSGLGTASLPGVMKSNNIGDPTANEAINDDYRNNLINKVEYVFDRLDKASKRIIECAYFQEGVITSDEVMMELTLNRNKYYSLKKNAICKFGISLGYF